MSVLPAQCHHLGPPTLPGLRTMNSSQAWCCFLSSVESSSNHLCSLFTWPVFSSGPDSPGPVGVWLCLCVHLLPSFHVTFSQLRSPFKPSVPWSPCRDWLLHSIPGPAWRGRATKISLNLHLKSVPHTLIDSFSSVSYIWINNPLGINLPFPQKSFLKSLHFLKTYFSLIHLLVSRGWECKSCPCLSLWWPLLYQR